MNRRSSPPARLICLLGIVAALLLAPKITRAQQTMFAGVVIDVNCSAELIEADSQTAKTLTVGKSGGRPLIDGERLRCKGPGSMTIVLADGRQTITKDKGWVPVRQGKDSAEDGRVRRACIHARKIPARINFHVAAG